MVSLVALGAGSACADEEVSLRLTEWQLHVGTEAPRLVQLPRRVDDLVPGSVRDVSLRAHILVPEHMRGTALTLSVPSWLSLVTAYAGGVELDRYGEDPRAPRGPLDAAYSNALAALVEARPEDPDALALWGEALLVQHGDAAWQAGGRRLAMIAGASMVQTRFTGASR